MQRPDAHVQSGVQICKTVCCYAAPRVHVQQRVPMCTAVCLFAGRDARVHNSLFICSAPCMYARRRVHSQKAVYMCRASCLFADVCACVQSRVLICTSTCTRARFTGSLQRKLNLRHDLWVEVTSQHGLLPESHPGVFETSKCQNVNPSAFSANNRRGYRSLAGISPEEHPGSTIPLTSLIQADFGYGAGMDVEFECQDCGIFRSGRAA